jgi:hypothetical protein
MGAITLYSLSDKHRSLEALADSDELPAEVIRDTLDALEGEIQEKSVSVAHFIRNAESTADAIEEAAQQMLKRAERLRNRAQSVTDYLLFHLQATGITKIESPFFTLSLRNNPPTVVIDSEADVPEQYKVQPPTPPTPPMRPDKKAIADAFKAGHEVPGCHVETRQRLEIKL